MEAVAGSGSVISAISLNCWLKEWWACSTIRLLMMAFFAWQLKILFNNSVLSTFVLFLTTAGRNLVPSTENGLKIIQWAPPIILDVKKTLITKLQSAKKAIFSLVYPKSQSVHWRVDIQYIWECREMKEGEWANKIYLRTICWENLSDQSMQSWYLQRWSWRLLLTPIHSV